MIKSRVTTNEHGDPVLTVTVTGFHDAYRFADGMTRLQCEFADHGHKRIASLRRRFTREGWQAAMDYFHGTGRRGFAPREWSVNQPALFDPAQTQPQHCPIGHCQAIRLAGQQDRVITCAHDLNQEHHRKRPRGCLNAIDPAHSDWGGF